MCCEGLIEKLPQLDYGCCCCKIETGSKVIALCRAVGGLLYTISGIMALVSEIKSPTSDENPTAAIVASIVIVLITSIVCIMALILLLGLCQEDMRKVKFWLRVSISMFFVMIALMIAAAVSVAFEGKGALGVVILAIYAVIFVLFDLYTMCIVKTHYHNMQNG